MNAYAIRALIDKDLKLYFRNKFILVITLLSVSVFCIMYFVLPDTVDETYEIGIVGSLPPGTTEMIGENEEGLLFVEFDNEESLKRSISDGDLLSGILFPEGWAADIMQGEKPELRLFFASDTPEEMVEIVRLMLSEFAFELSGKTLRNIMWEGSIIGQDMTGSQIPYRERMRPLIAIFILLMEIFGLAGLITEEVEHRTSEALLITSLSVSSIFTAKIILGTFLAFSQAVLVMVIIGGMNNGPFIIITALLLGAVMAVAASFITASLGKDFLSVAAWGMPILILLAVPGFSAVIPGSTAGWVRFIPSWFLADTVFKVVQFDAGWGDVWKNLVVLVGTDIVLIAAGVLSLRRKFS